VGLRHLELEYTACTSLDQQAEALAWQVSGQGPRRSEGMFITLESVRRRHRVWAAVWHLPSLDP